MKKRNIVLLAGAAMVLAGIIAASVILMKVSHSDGERSQELTTTERKEDADDEEGNTTERREPDEKEIMDVYGPGYLYYLDPDGEEAFKKRLTAFTADMRIDASSAAVLEGHMDDRSNEEEPALFYLQLDDEAGTVIQVSFEKTSGRYAFDVHEGEANAAHHGWDKGEGRTEYEISESSEDEETPEVAVRITDTEIAIAEDIDREALEKKLAAWLTLVGESRRDFYVSSFMKTDQGYEAVLDFETVRNDGGNVEVKYDGTYHFRLV